MKNFLIQLIRIYQATISPDHGLRRGGFAGCRYFPSCSEYAVRAIDKYGAFKGVLLAIKRVSRCHPFAQGGVDEP